MKTKKRLFSLLLCVAMLFSLCPQAAFAGDEGSGGTETHTHCVCGASHTAIGDHTNEESISFEAWTATDSLPNISGNYYLTNDVTLSGTWSPSSDVVLCLNGHNITTTGSDKVIRIRENCRFTLTDCKSGGAQGKVTHDTTNTDTARGVWTEAKATFNLYGGSITGNAAYGGSGVYVATAVFNMYGGSIKGNHTISTSNISGGGVCVTGGKFNMYGGTISDNSVNTNGGGVYVWNNGRFTMSGGTISGNSAGAGGGVYLSDDYLYNLITLSGDAKITGNTLANDNTDSNVYLSSGMTIKVESGFNGKVGITTATSPTVSAPVTVLDGSTDYSTITGSFTFDANPNYHFNDSGQMAVDPCTTHSYQSGTCTVCGFVCPHSRVGTDQKQCEDCQATLITKVEHTEESVTTTYYADFSIAIEAAGTGDTVMLLDNVTGTFSCASKDFILDLNGKTLSGLNISGKAIKVKDSAGGGKITLSATGGVNISDLLETGCAFKSESTWYDRYNNSTATSITDAEVTQVPISGVRIAAAGDTTLVYGYTAAPTFTATQTGTAADAGVTYKWYVGDDEQIGTGSTFTFPTGKSVDTYDVRCEVTAGTDGYAVTGETSVTVTKATLTEGTDYTAPTAKTGLTYSGSDSLTGNPELINKGIFSNTIPNAENNGPIFRYGQKGSDGIIKWDNTQWSCDAGTYTICWYIEGGANYENVGSLENPAGSMEVHIDPKPVTPAVTVSDGTFTYDGTAKKPAVTVKDGETTISENEYTVVYSDNVNAGTATVTVTDKTGGNYAITKTTQTFEIAKAGKTDQAATGSAPYGATVEVDLSSLIGQGGKLKITDTTDNDTVLNGNAGLDGSTLKLAFHNDSSLIGKSADITVSVTDCTNYGDYKILVTVSVTDKQTPTVTAADITQTYSGAVLKDTVITGETGGVAGTWSWKGGNAPKDVADSKIWTVVFTPDDTVNYKTVETTVSVTINPRGVTLSGLFVENKTYDGTTTAKVTGTAVINGKFGNDDVTVQNGTAAFEDKTAGTGKTVTFSGYALTGADAGNYTLTAQPTATADISRKSVTVSGVTATDRDYKENDTGVELSGGTVDGVLNGDDVTIDFTSATGTMENADASDKAKSVTVSGVQLAGKDAGNYVLSAQPTGVTVNISIIAYTGSTTATGSAKYGASNTVDLSGLIMSGGTAAIADGDITDTNGILNGTPSINGTALTFTFAENAVPDQTATVTVNVSDCTNYENYTITVTLTVSDKNVPTVTAPAAKTLTYNGADQVLIEAAKTTGGTLQYKLGESGTWSAELPKAKNAGIYTVYYKVIGNTDYADVPEASIPVTIAKKNMTVKPKSYSITQGNAIPTFALEFDGLANGDSLNMVGAVQFTCTEADGTTPVSTQTAAGTYTITWTNAAAFAFTTETNYAVTKVSTGTLTISAKPSSSGGSGGYSGGASGGATAPTEKPTDKPENKPTLDRTELLEMTIRLPLQIISRLPLFSRVMWPWLWNFKIFK